MRKIFILLRNANSSFLICFYALLVLCRSLFLYHFITISLSYIAHTNISEYNPLIKAPNKRDLLPVSTKYLFNLITHFLTCLACFSFYSNEQLSRRRPALKTHIHSHSNTQSHNSLQRYKYYYIQSILLINNFIYKKKIRKVFCS